jgi:hypothetical protein
VDFVTIENAAQFAAAQTIVYLCILAIASETIFIKSS